MSLASTETSPVELSGNEPTTSNNTADMLHAETPIRNVSSEVLEASTPIKRRDFSVSEKVELLMKYDTLPKMSQSKAARELGISKQLVCRLLQQRADIMQAWLHNKDTNRKRKRCGKDGEVETALKDWFDRACIQGATVTGPIMRKKAEELAKKLGKEDFVATDGWFSRWRKRENIILLGKPRGEQSISDVPASQWPDMLAAYSAECIYGAEGNTSIEKGLDAQASSSTRTDVHSTPDIPNVRAIVQQCPTKRRDLSISEKLELLAKYDALPQMSQCLAASQLGVSQPLLCKILKTRHEIEQESLQNSSRKRKRCGKDGEVETALKEWFDQAQKEGVSLTGPIMRKKAEELARELGKRDFVATDGWFSRWRKRENISTGKTRGSSESNQSLGLSIEGDSVPLETDDCGSGFVMNDPTTGMADTNTPSDEAALRRPIYTTECVNVSSTELDVKPVITSTTSDEYVSQWYSYPDNDTTALLSAYQPDSIYSIEITGVTYLAKPSFNEESNLELPQERLSILCCVNLCGSKQKLLAVGQRDKRVCFRNIRKLPVDYYFNDEARVTPHIIFDWLMKWDRNLDHEIVLMMDDCQDLRSITSFEHLKFMPVPESLRSCETNLSRILLSEFSGLKQQRLKWLRQGSGECDENFSSTVSDSNVQSTDFVTFLHIVAQAWENVPTRSVIERFIECGVLAGPGSIIPSKHLPPEFTAASRIKIETWDSETITDLVVDQHDTPPPSNERIKNALSVLTQAIHHRADEFSLHYQYEKFVHSLLW